MIPEPKKRKKIKKKTKGTPDLGKRNTDLHRDWVDLAVKNNNFEIEVDERSEPRWVALEEIEEIRRANSATDKDINKLLNNATKFVNGEIVFLQHNKEALAWSLDIGDYRAIYERNHRQRNESSSRWKGYKLNRVLDACARCYLQGWDEENVRKYLADYNKRNLYYLPAYLLYILWERGE